MGRLLRRLAPYVPDPIQVVTTRQPDPPPRPVMDYGLLDGAPSPRAPDRIVFGGWYPTCERRSEAYAHPCRACGCAQAEMGPCWQCGAMVAP
jgi:hypothetical protein